MISNSTCQPPLQLIEVKGKLARRGLKVALTKKGLRRKHAGHITRHQCLKVALTKKGLRLTIHRGYHAVTTLESSPVPEGIKIYLTRFH